MYGHGVQREVPTVQIRYYVGRSFHIRQGPGTAVGLGASGREVHDAERAAAHFAGSESGDTLYRTADLPRVVARNAHGIAFNRDVEVGGRVPQDNVAHHASYYKDAKPALLAQLPNAAQLPCDRSRQGFIQSGS